MTALVSHLKLLEAESIHIFREAAAQFRAPVLLYSIGKDSTVLLHLARKAFWPAKPPFPLLHIDTTWKFRDMIAFRDKTARELGLDLIVHTNHDGLARDINPFDHPPSVYTDVMKTQALARRRSMPAASMPPSAARAATRRPPAPRSGCSPSAPQAIAGSRAASGPKCGTLLNGRLGKGETVRVFPLSNWTEGDVWRYIALEKLDVVPLYFAAPRAGGVARRPAHRGRRRAHAASARRDAGDPHQSASARSAAGRSPRRSSPRHAISMRWWQEVARAPRTRSGQGG